MISLTLGQASNLKYLEVSRFCKLAEFTFYFPTTEEKGKKRFFTWEMINKIFVLCQLTTNRERKKLNYRWHQHCPVPVIWNLQTHTCTHAHMFTATNTCTFNFGSD